MALKVIQVNLQHKKAASAAFCIFVVKENVDITLIQEPWVHQGCVSGLGDCKGKLIHCGTGERFRSCILVHSGIQCLPMVKFCSRDLTTIQIDQQITGGHRGLILSSVYLPYDVGNPPTRELEQLADHCTNNGDHIIYGCDANSHMKSGVAVMSTPEVSTYQNF